MQKCLGKSAKIINFDKIEFFGYQDISIFYACFYGLMHVLIVFINQRPRGIHYKA